MLMPRSFDITSVEVIPTLGNFHNAIIKINFTYGDAESHLVGSCHLPAPSRDFIPLDQVSKDTALEWLASNCPNTTEQFDLQLDLKNNQQNNQPFIYDWNNPAAS